MRGWAALSSVSINWVNSWPIGLKDSRGNELLCNVDGGPGMGWVQPEAEYPEDSGGNCGVSIRKGFLKLWQKIFWTSMFQSMISAHCSISKWTPWPCRFRPYAVLILTRSVYAGLPTPQTWMCAHRLVHFRLSSWNSLCFFLKYVLHWFLSKNLILFC